MKIRRARLTPLRLPLRRALVRRGDRIVYRESLLVTLECSEGVCGFGEASPAPGFPTECLARSEAALRAELAHLVGAEAPAPFELPSNLGPALADTPCARAALELALWDLHARWAGRPLAAMLGERFGAPARPRVSVNALLDAQEPERLAAAAQDARREGFGSMKWKLAGSSVAAECARASAARRTVGAEVGLRVDANGQLDEDEAIELARALAAYDLEYLEQPVPARETEAMARVRRATPVPIAADESATRPEGARAVIEAGAADVLVVKPGLCGGISDAWAIAAAARSAGLGVVVTTALESAVGVSGAAHLAAILPEPLGACGLATGMLLAGDVARLLPIEAGELRIPEDPGLGVVPDVVELARLRSAPDWEVGA